jgi:outer membrane protein TolC
VAVATTLAALCAGAASAEDAAEILTVERAVEQALHANRRVTIASLRVEAADERVAASRTHRLPSLSLQAMGGKLLDNVGVSFPAGAFGKYPGIGPIPAVDTLVQAPRSLSASVDATLAQPLTQLRRISLGTKLSELGRDAEREKLREQRAAIADDVRRTYYQVLQAESAMGAAEERMQVYRELDRMVEEQVRVEAALPSDRLEVKARLASQEQELAQRRGDVAEGREQLNFLLGRELDHQMTLAAVPEAPLEEVDLQSAMTAALERRPDLARARLQVDQADTDRRLKKSESIPDLSLAVSYVTFVNVDLLPRNVVQAGLQLKWEPLDWGRRGKERAETDLQAEQARQALREAEAQVRLQVSHAFRKLEEARLSVRAARLRLDAAREKLRLAAKRHSVEAALWKDVLEAQASASDAGMQYDRALSVFWTAKADFRAALGEE